MLTTHRKKADRYAADFAHVRQQYRDEKAALRTAKQNLRAADAARQLLQAVAVAVQQTAHKKIAAVVSKCLVAVFGPAAYEFKIHFDRKRGKTEARLVFVRAGEELAPIDAAGGGVVAIAAFALRVACLVLAQPPLRRLLVLDEPFVHLSEQYRAAAREMIETLAAELGVQFVIVTHSPDLRIGRVVEL